MRGRMRRDCTYIAHADVLHALCFLYLVYVVVYTDLVSGCRVGDRVLPGIGFRCDGDQRIIAGKS